MRMVFPQKKLLSSIVVCEEIGKTARKLCPIVVDRKPCESTRCVRFVIPQTGATRIYLFCAFRDLANRKGLRIYSLICVRVNFFHGVAFVPVTESTVLSEPRNMI